MDTTSFHVDYLAEHRLAVWRPVGVLTQERVAQLLEFMLALEARSSESFNRLLDLTFITEFPFPTTVIYQYAARRRESVDDLAPCRTAIIAPGSDAHRVAIIYQALMHGSPISVEVFRNPEAAARWLSVPQGVVEPQLAGHA